MGTQQVQLKKVRGLSSMATYVLLMSITQPELEDS